MMHGWDGGTGRAHTRRHRRVGTVALLGVVVTSLFVACASGTETWPEGTTHGPWRSIFTGYGTTGTTDSGTLIVSPTPPTGTDTHAALIASVASYDDLDARIQLRTNAQLRQPRPNPWEVGWVLWHYTDSTHFYYVALKPTGWEIGKEDPAYPGAQRFLASGTTPYAINQWHEIRIQQFGDTFDVWADGTQLASITDDANPYPRGSIGLYAEDSIAEFKPLSP